MIGKIKGTLTEIDQNTGLIETASGTSYRVYLTPHLIKSHPIDSPIEVYTYLQVREDALTLFGFKTRGEFDFFRLLLTVSGVGPKTAYSIISYLSVDKMTQAIKENDVAVFTSIPGLGKKTAMKIILELSQKLKEEFKMEKMYLSEDDKVVVDVLISLGFKSQEANSLLPKIPRELSIEEKIKKGIQLATNHKKL